MKNNKGQALIEFIIVLPLLILFIASIIDLTHVLTRKNNLENELDLIVAMYRNQELEELYNYAESKEISVDIQTVNNITTIVLSEEIRISAPGLNLVFKDPYLVEAERVIYDE